METVTVSKRDLAALLNPPFGSYCVWQSCGDAVAAEIIDEWKRRRDSLRNALSDADRTDLDRDYGRKP